MSDRKLVSIIIPVYNMEKYLNECMESIVSQTYGNLEIILVNDGSTDGSLEICRKYEKTDKRIVVINKENEGLALAREYGFCHARGEYFVTIDADDILAPEYIEKLYNCITANNADICVCGVTCFRGEYERKVPIRSKVDGAQEINADLLKKNFYRYIREYQLSDSWNKMYRRQFIINSGVHYTMPRQHNGTDLLFNYLLFFHNPTIIWCKEYLYRYRLTDNSRVRRKGKKLEQGFLYAVNELEKEARKQKIYSIVKRQIIVSYVDMMKYASLDIYMEGGDLNRRYTEFMVYRYKYGFREFLLANMIMPLNLKIFHFILFTGNTRMLIKYYVIRDKLKSRKRQVD